MGAFALRWLGFIGVGSYFSIYRRFDAPMFGSFVALLVSSSLRPRALSTIFVVAGWLGAGTLAAVLVPIGKILDMEIRADHIFTVFGIPALSLMASSAIGLAVMNSGSKYLCLVRLRLLRFTGTISYMLYRLHGLVYLCFLHFFQPTWVVSLAALCCAVGLSWLSWLYIESPILKERRSP